MAMHSSHVAHNERSAAGVEGHCGNETLEWNSYRVAGGVSSARLKMAAISAVTLLGRGRRRVGGAGVCVPVPVRPWRPAVPAPRGFTFRNMCGAGLPPPPRPHHTDRGALHSILPRRGPLIMRLI